MGISAVVAAVGAAATYVSHKDAKSAQADQRNAMVQQQVQGEVALTAQSDALAQQKTAADAALAQQKLADQARIDQTNAAMAQQKGEFDTTFAASQASAAGQLQAQKDIAAQQLKTTALTNELQMKTAQKAADAQNNALQAQVAAADRLYTQQTEAMNKANQKQPDTAAITAENKAAGKSGQSGTMLTGPTGIDMSSLLLGKNTLLGA